MPFFKNESFHFLKEVSGFLFVIVKNFKMPSLFKVMILSSFHFIAHIVKAHHQLDI